MARAPLTGQEVAPTRLVLNVEKVGLTEEQFLQLCRETSSTSQKFGDGKSGP